MKAKPLQGCERSGLLDALRGFALFGILFGNFTWFTGYAVASADQRAALPGGALDGALAWVIHFAVDGKFYSLFALLFGVGYAIQAERAQQQERSFRTLFLRRMLVLLLLGGLHAIGLWFGDILSLYAVAGMFLLLLEPYFAKHRLRWAGLLLLAPVVLSFALLAYESWFGSASEDSLGYGPAALLPAFGSGSYEQIFQANAAFLKERWVLALYSGRFLKLIGMFLIGIHLWRRGLLKDPDRHRRALRRMLKLGLAIGIPANIALAYLLEAVPERPPSLAGSLRATTYALAAPSLALAYLAAFCLLHRAGRLRSLSPRLAAAGRMSLSHYLAQSLIGVALFYGYGFGLWGQLGLAPAVLMVLAACALLTLLSQWWWKHFRFGPAEWLWRSLSYGRRLPMRRAPRALSDRPAHP